MRQAEAGRGRAKRRTGCCRGAQNGAFCVVMVRHAATRIVSIEARKKLQARQSRKAALLATHSSSNLPNSSTTGDRGESSLLDVGDTSPSAASAAASAASEAGFSKLLNDAASAAPARGAMLTTARPSATFPVAAARPAPRSTAGRPHHQPSQPPPWAIDLVVPVGAHPIRTRHCL